MSTTPCDVVCRWLAQARRVLKELQAVYPDMRVSLGLGASEDLDAVSTVYVHSCFVCPHTLLFALHCRFPKHFRR